MLGHCEPPTALSKLTFERKKIPFSIVGFRTPMRCLCRPGRACFFLFCLPLIFLTDSSSSETETGFLSSGFVAALRFVHNCPTRLQQGRFGVLPVLLPYLASKTANRATQGRVWVHRLFLECFGSGRVAKSRSNL